MKTEIERLQEKQQITTFSIILQRHDCFYLFIVIARSATYNRIKYIQQAFTTFSFSLSILYVFSCVVNSKFGVKRASKWKFVFFRIFFLSLLYVLVYCRFSFYIFIIIAMIILFGSRFIWFLLDVHMIFTFFCHLYNMCMCVYVMITIKG